MGRPEVGRIRDEFVVEDCVLVGVVLNPQRRSVERSSDAFLTPQDFLLLLLFAIPASNQKFTFLKIENNYLRYTSLIE